MVSSILEGPTDSDRDIVESCFRKCEHLSSSKDFKCDPRLCSLCLGILQFKFFDERKTLVKRDTPDDMAVRIADIVKEEGHQIDSFSLEVSIPSIILENECSIQNDVLQDCKSSMSSFRIRLIYNHTNSSKEVEKALDCNNSCKRRKTGMDDSVDAANDSTVSCGECSDSTIGESDLVGEKPFNSLANEPCHFSVYCYRTPVCFGGRYLKYSRNVSQTRWIIDDERMGETSVEEIIGGNILQMCHGDNYKFHAAGREDIDVRMLGTGRPFLVEVQNVRHIPSELLVRVKNLKLVGSQGWNLMREGEAEKQKQYAALVWISRPVKDEDLQCLSSLKDVKILQRTPIRVLHRRSPLEREKIIHWMKIETIAGSSQYFLLHLCTQAGTYIKEFVHGDFGRTHPSIGSILGCRAEILQLDVTNVKMDCFLSE
ncbi:putative tRNA pseudouridine synthase Pus10 isoform X1 [Senna tora]|uniref:tRNA pseudouridine(55) synthase n=1 Tax=Senna tora TaxID=362788 RepID=A0A834U0P8_9FABA|nr:putative tRNA pseudouridine synthase Pus10 isoform X1 [Senna tora]